MYKKLTPAKTFDGLRQRAEQAEQTHRGAEDKYRTYAGEYFQMSSMRQKLAHDGENSLPFQLFIKPSTVKLDTWRLDFERVDLLIQDAFRLFSAFPVNFSSISTHLDKAERGLTRIHDKLKTSQKRSTYKSRSQRQGRLTGKHGILGMKSSKEKKGMPLQLGP